MMKTLVTVGPNSLNLDDLTHFAEKTKLTINFMKLKMKEYDELANELDQINRKR